MIPLYQVIDLPLSFRHKSTQNPLTVDLRVNFTADNGEYIPVPAFWDGKAWRVRFSPTRLGKWEWGYGSALAAVETGSFECVPVPSTVNVKLHQHGQFLKASGKRLTYTDGTPFLWLGDTWWNFPQMELTLPIVEACARKRISQGFTVYQSHGRRPMFVRGRNAYEAGRIDTPTTWDYWNAIDPYFQMLHSRGLLGCVGFGAHVAWDALTVENLKQLFRYHLARYGCYGITYLFLQEFDAPLGLCQERIEKVREVARYVRDIDPYRRALTAHPASNASDSRSFWGDDWCGFVMLQSGHGTLSSSARYNLPTEKPVVEAEHNYEGFTRTNEVMVRESAYTAVLSGAGFTYGAQGLYAGIVDKAVDFGTKNWGPVLTWEEGLNLPAGDQLKYLMALWKSFDQASFKAMPGEGMVGLTICRDAKNVYLHFQSRYAATSSAKAIGAARLEGVAGEVGAGATLYRGQWFNPRTGRMGAMVAFDGFPVPPSAEDWMFVVRS